MLGHALAHGLRHAKVDHLELCAFTLDHKGEHIARFQVTVHNALEMRVLHRFARLLKELQAFINTEFDSVAELGDRLALHVLHGEVGSTLRSQTAVEDLGDPGVIHDRQRLALLIEARHYGL